MSQEVRINFTANTAGFLSGVRNIQTSPCSNRSSSQSPSRQKIPRSYSRELREGLVCAILFQKETHQYNAPAEQYEAPAKKTEIKSKGIRKHAHDTDRHEQDIPQCF